MPGKVMPKKDKRKSKPRSVIASQAKLRGLISATRNSRTYNDKSINPNRNDLAHKKSMLAYGYDSALLLAREEIPDSHYDQYFNWAEKQANALLPKALKNLKPTLGSLSHTRRAKAIPLSSEIYWLLARLRCEKPQIERYLELRAILEHLFWQGDWRRIAVVNSQIEQELGQSVWLVEARISLEQHFHGLESQKRLSEQIKKDAGRGFIRFLTHRLSMRNEPAVSLQRHAASVHDYIATRNLEPEMACFLRYKLCREVPTTEKNIGELLRFQQNHSIIDRYEGLIHVTQELLSTNNSQLTQFLVPALRELQFSDPRVRKLIDISSAPPAVHSPVSCLEPASMLIAGQVKEGMRRAVNCFKRSPRVDVFQLYVIAEALSLGAVKGGTLNSIPRRRFPRLLANVIGKNSQATSSYRQLEKECLNFSAVFPSCQALADLAAIKKHSAANLEPHAMRHCLNNPYFSPLEAAPASALGRNIYPASDSLPNWNVTCFFQAQHYGKVDDTLPQLSKSWSYINFLYQATSYAKCISEINFLKASDNPCELLRRVELIEIECLIDTGRTLEAIKLAARLLAEDSNMEELVPVSSIISPETKWPDLRRFADDISLSILIDQAYKLAPTDHLATLRRTAVDQFIRLNSFSRPSDLSECVDEISHSKAIYFFRNLCVSSILDMCKCLKGTKAVDEERRRVLAALRVLDPVRAEEYDAEILAISSSLRIREGLKVVDGSRIHVDIEGISRWAQDELQENLSRYKNLVKAGVGVAENIETVLKDFLSQSLPKAYLDVPKSEADDILVTMLWSLRESFLFNKPHGLNSYLSKRVRHNSIAGYLRGALENEHLITAKDSGGLYRDNGYWRAKLKHHSTQDIDATLACLEEFGAKFDGLTAHIKNSVLHIKRAEYPQGVIDLQITANAVHFSRSVLQSSDYNLSAWLDMCLSLFWHSLEPSLFKAREILSKDYKAKFSELFDSLRADLIKATGKDNQSHELTSSINSASAELQVLLDRASDWFSRRQGELSKYMYTLSETIDISVEAALTRHKGCSIEVTKTLTGSMQLRADTLVVIADILLIVIGNISEHSGRRENATLEITAEIYDSGSIKLRFESSVHPDKYTKPNLDIVEVIRQDIESGCYLEKMAREGRSGLYKVASIVKPDIDGHMEFGYADGNKFILDIAISLEIESVPFESYGLAEAEGEVTTS